jgi:hypothetical protein
MFRLSMHGFAAVFVLATGSGAHADEFLAGPEPEIDGLLLRENGEVIVTVWQGVVYEGIFVAPLAATGEIAVTWLDPDSTEIQPDPKLFELQSEVVDPRIATYQPAAPWSFTITGVAEGATDVILRAWHIKEQHVDFESPPIPILVQDPVGIAEAASPATSGITLLPLSPNPFTVSTGVRFRLDQPAEISLTVFDATGRIAARLLQGAQPEGLQEMRWDAGGLPSGLYLVRLEGTSGTQVEKVILVR